VPSRVAGEVNHEALLLDLSGHTGHSAGDFHDEQVSKLLNLLEDEKPLYIVPVGRK